MTINYSGINVNYPVAGQDNDSQGFRDNFSAISGAFSQADASLTGLTTSTAKLNVDNDFLSNGISHAVFKNNVGEYVSNTMASNPYTVYVNQATYHELALSTSTAVQFNGWPNTTNWTSNQYYASVRLEIVPSQTAATLGFNLTFQAAVSGGKFHFDQEDVGIDINGNGDVFYSSTSTNAQLWDVWTTNGGQDTFIKRVGSYKSN